MMMMKQVFRVVLALAFSCVAGRAALADGDAAAGKVLFMKCAICHSPDAGVNKIGPSLHDIVGRHSATISNFTYSPAMQKADKVWDEAQLNTYLTNPSAVVPGTKMMFPGFKSETDRQNIIAYLATLK
jgi:cytochrome c